MRETLAHGNYTQNEHTNSQKKVWLDTRQAHDHIARNLDKHEWDEEDPETGIVAVAGHVEAFL